MKIDLHIHLEKRDYRYARRVIHQSGESGMDAICLVEHDVTGPPDYFNDLSGDSGMPVFWATEYSSQEGHILVFTRNNNFEISHIKLPMQEIINRAKSLGGIAIPVHPYTNLHRSGLGNGVFELENIIAIETINGALDDECNLMAERARAVLNLKGIGGSDAHSEFMVGRAFTIFRRKIKTQAELIDTLISGRYSASRRKYQTVGAGYISSMGDF
ncbi:MAG: PHP domain-containing protein [Candidatus Eremiobacteraeota bacterium]|nr:PHP domain-containing protein [Candidatus Eremiobacteraeota bacterium]